MRTAKEIYEQEIRENNKDYKVTIKEFTEWLNESNHLKEFKNSLKENDDYFTAVDFSIYVSMVKWFRVTL